MLREGRRQYTGNRTRERQTSREVEAQSYRALLRRGGRAAGKRVLMRSFYSSYAGSETVHSEKGIVGGLLLAMVVSTLLASVVAVLVFPANSTRGAATLSPNFARSQVVGGLADPTAMAFAPDGRLFVAEQRGTLRVVKAGGTLATFLDISGRVASAGGTRPVRGRLRPRFLQKPLRLSLLHAESDYHLLGPQPGDPRRRQW